MITLQAPPDPARIRLATRFGEFEADPRNLVSFPAGLPGFEQCRRFAILTSPEAAPLQCLHACDGPPASFLAVDPRLAMPDYVCVPEAADLIRLKASAGEYLLWLALLTFDDSGAAFANLRAPVAINPKAMLGLQLMPRRPRYGLRHPLAIR